MNGKKSVTLKFTLSAEFIGNENATHSTIGTPETLTGLHIDPMGDIRDARP